MKTVLGFAALLTLAEGPSPAEPPDYRHESYRAPVPATLAGAVVVDVAQAEALWRAGAGFLDVMPRPVKPEGLPEGTLWRDRPRLSIPGAVWAPNTGHGRLSSGADAYLRAGLAAARGDDPGRPVVVFCESDCWMSWNAARRGVVEYGLTGVHWFPAGADGWAAEGLPLERVEPLPPP